MNREFEQSVEEKQYWKGAAERRKANAIRLGRWAINIDPHAIVACEEFWQSWCAAFGKERATDFLVEGMTEEHFLLLDRLEYQKRGNLIENHSDKAATKLARKAKEIHAPSWISIAGHVYLESGEDLRALRSQLLEHQKNKCGICKKPLQPWDMDLEHIRGGRPLARCACFYRRLADGSVCTNVMVVHGMFSDEPCHRNKHNREPKLRWR